MSDLRMASRLGLAGTTLSLDAESLQPRRRADSCLPMRADRFIYIHT
jgi:hypothetical protein